jgi:hypothetical protein
MGAGHEQKYLSNICHRHSPVTYSHRINTALDMADGDVFEIEAPQICAIMCMFLISISALLRCRGPTHSVA